MDIETFKMLILDNFKTLHVKNNSYIVYFPFYYSGTEENFPLGITLSDDHCILTDMGNFVEKLLEKDENFDFESARVKDILTRYSAEFDGRHIVMTTPFEHIVYRVSDYFQILTLLINL